MKNEWFNFISEGIKSPAVANVFRRRAPNRWNPDISIQTPRYMVLCLSGNRLQFPSQLRSIPTSTNQHDILRATRTFLCITRTILGLGGRALSLNLVRAVTQDTIKKEESVDLVSKKTEDEDVVERSTKRRRIEKKEKDGRVKFDRQRTFAYCMSSFFPFSRTAVWLISSLAETRMTISMTPISI